MTITDAPGKVSQVVNFGELIGFKDYVVVAVAVEFGETRMCQGFSIEEFRRGPSEIAASKRRDAEQRLRHLHTLG
jgi:hypothetical protein